MVTNSTRLPVTLKREAKGGAYVAHGKIFGRVTVAKGKRHSVAMPWAATIDEARDRAFVLQRWTSRLLEAGHGAHVDAFLRSGAEVGAPLVELEAAVTGLVAGRLRAAGATPGTPAALTIRLFAERWTSGVLAGQYPDDVEVKRTASEDEGRLGKHVYPIVGDVPLADFSLGHAREVLRRIPRTASRSTRRHVAQLLVRIMNLAVSPCDLLKVSPLPRGFLPKLGKARAMSYLYPSEDATLLACGSVPLVHRLLYGLLAREGMRCNEAQSLTWAQLDLKRGGIRLDVNKTDDPRPWALDAGTAEALRCWSAMHPDDLPGDRVFRGLARPYYLAAAFRSHLTAAGIDRAELFEKNAVRRPIRVHDLRATFVTLALASGKTETWVMDRTGHKSSAMINRYRRQARHAEEIGLGWLTSLDEAIPELSRGCARGCSDDDEGARSETIASDAEGFRRMDSNHDKRIQNPLSCH